MHQLLIEGIALAQVVFIDVVLAGDNAIVVGMAAAGVPQVDRFKVFFWGVAAAVVLRIIFAVLATELLAVVGLTLAGGLILLWVCWKLWREIASQRAAALASSGEASGEAGEVVPKTVLQAVCQVALADVSMSLDNVLAVAGAARDHVGVLVVGLMLSVGLMGLAASFIARLLTRFHWIAYFGLAVIAYVALNMIYRGSLEVLAAAG